MQPSSTGMSPHRHQPLSRQAVARSHDSKPVPLKGIDDYVGRWPTRVRRGVHAVPHAQAGCHTANDDQTRTYDPPEPSPWIEPDRRAVQEVAGSVTRIRRCHRSSATAQPFCFTFNHRLVAPPAVRAGLVLGHVVLA